MAMKIEKVTKATVRLFKAVPLKIEESNPINNKESKEVSEYQYLKTIPKGFVFTPEVYANYSEKEIHILAELVAKEIELNAEQMNSSFHKSWKKVKDTPIEQLVIEQIAHYMTTYGKENPIEYLNQKEAQWNVDELADKVEDLEDIDFNRIWDEDYVYIPNEVLDIPELRTKEIQLVIIKGYFKLELKIKLGNLLNMGVALSEKTQKDIVTVASFVGFDLEDIEKIKNKEVKMIMYGNMGLLPQDPVEFLRYVVYLSTGQALLIKSSELINEIKSNNNTALISVFAKYEKEVGLERLAEIFFRFKPLFLAFKSNHSLRMCINRIRKLADKYHKPMPVDYLNSVTALAKTEDGLVLDKLESELNKVNIFRKIRLAYALQYRTKDPESILYRIRNGKAYATEFEFKNKDNAKAALNVVLDSIVSDVNGNIKGKKIYIPEYVSYALPATEKQFTGYFPAGTCVTIPKDMVFGIHWENVDSNRIDLDLSLMSVSNGKIGWDGSYRNRDSSVLFSGDMTDAKKPKGASELFYIKRQIKDAMMMSVNYYNYDEEIDVPFQIFVAKEQIANMKKNYTVNPNNVVAVANSTINKRQKLLGLIVTTTKECRFYFVEAYLGNSITARQTPFAENTRKYLFNFYENSIDLKYILKKAGAKLTEEKEECDINLSPEALEKDTILTLITK